MIGCKYFAEQSGTKQLSCTEQIALEMYKTDSKFTIFLSHERLLVSCGKERNRKKKELLRNSSKLFKGSNKLL